MDVFRNKAVVIVLLSAMGCMADIENGAEEEEIDVGKIEAALHGDVYYQDSLEIKKPVFGPMLLPKHGYSIENSYRLDWCKNNGSNCGKPAADAYCQKLKLGNASSYSKDSNIGAVSPTKSISGHVCTNAGCDGFKAIKCSGDGWTNARKRLLNEIHWYGMQSSLAKTYEGCINYKMKEHYQQCDYDDKNRESDIRNVVEPVVDVSRSPWDVDVALDFNNSGNYPDYYWSNGTAPGGTYLNQDEQFKFKAGFAYAADYAASTFHRYYTGDWGHPWWAGVMWHEVTHNHGYHHEDQAACGNTVQYNTPKLHGMRVDYCKNWAADCGKPAADEYCRLRGHSYSSDYKKAYDVGYTKLVTGQECHKSTCDSFQYVKCRKNFVLDDNGGNRNWTKGDDSVPYIVKQCIMDTLENSAGDDSRTSETVAQGKMVTYGPYSVGENIAVSIKPSYGNPNLFVRKGGVPTTTNYTCKSAKSGTAIDTCLLGNGLGSYWVGVYGQQGSGYELSVIYDRETLDFGPYDHTISQGSWARHTIDTTGQLSLEVEVLTGDADLYIRKAGAPSTTSYDYRQNSSGLMSERLYVIDPGRWYIGIYGKKASSVKFSAWYSH